MTAERTILVTGANSGIGLASVVELADRGFHAVGSVRSQAKALALPHMRAQGGGRIVQVSSIYGRFTTPLTGWYQAAKHALEAASDALRMEVARDGIDVVLIEPGGIRTNLWEDA
ncbi:MAG: SDR family NAD(P)-dependent oxidoreductase, partial [Actinobacteria bacterium]|nr:SDR family NAD(P)-dependent oxidoreductase [Actinomycetota bacterium]